MNQSIKKSDDINEPGWDLTRIHVNTQRFSIRSFVAFSEKPAFIGANFIFSAI